MTRTLEDFLGLEGAAVPDPGTVSAAAAPSEVLDDAFALTWPAEFPDHFSASQVVTLGRCEELWRLRYLQGKKSPPKGYLAWGSADHSTMEENFKTKMASGLDLPIEDVRTLFATKLDEYVDRAGEVDWERSSHAETKDRGVELVTAYRRQVAPSVQPIAVEREIRVVRPEWPVPVVGYIDVEQRKELNERKTSSRKVSTPSLDWAMQGRIYQLAEPKPVSWHVSTKTKTPAVYTPEEEPGLSIVVEPMEQVLTVVYVAKVLRKLMALYWAFGPDEPWPGAKERRDSACGYCAFRYNGACSHWGAA